MSTISPAPDPDRRILIGRIVKNRGLRGDLKILPLTWNLERFAELESIWVHTADGEDRLLTIKRLRIENEMVFIRFNEIPLRDLAEPLIGGELFIDVANRAELPEDRYYIDDVVGCKVTCSRFGELGVLDRVLDYPANDVWQVQGPLGEILIPVIHEIVDEVDIESREIRVTLPDGLIELNKPDPEKVARQPRKRSPNQTGGA